MWGIIIPALATILAAWGGSWATASSRVGMIDTKVQVIEEREQNHYGEVSKKLDSIDKKIDALINKK